MASASKRSRAARTSTSAASLARRRRVVSKRALDRDLQQRNEFALDILGDVIGGAGLQRGDRDTAVLRRGNKDHRRRIGHFQDAGERLQTIDTRHVLIERDRIDAARAARRVSPSAPELDVFNR